MLPVHQAEALARVLAVRSVVTREHSRLDGEEGHLLLLRPCAQ